jgi:hypothetical protein
MMPFPKVSVITVNWNNFNDSAECLESLRKTTYSNFEVIVVDNGSGGDDVSLLKQRFGDSIRLIVNDKNSGFAGGCNIGIKDALARGADYVVLLNNDTVVAPDFLEGLVRVAQSDERVGIAGGKVFCYELPELIWFAGGIINYRTGRTPIRGSGEADKGQFDEIVRVDWISGCFMFISRDVLQAVGMLDERFFFGWEDVDLCVRAARKGFKVLFVPESRIWHKGFGIDKRDRLMGMPVYYATRGQFLFMEKHFAKPQLAVAWLYFVVTFPGCVWVYSRILHQWKVPLYILWGIGGYLRIKFREYAKI